MSHLSPAGDSQPGDNLGSSIADLLAQAKALHRQGKTTEAWPLYELAVKNAPDSAEAWHFLGLLNFQTGYRDTGITAVRHSLTLNPDYADAYANLGNMLVLVDKASEAEGPLERALALAPDSLPPLVALALIHRMSGEPAKAEALLRPAVERNPDNIALRFGMANTLLALGRTEEAIEHGLQAVALDPDVGDGHRLLGYALCKLGRFDDAAQYFRKRLEASPDDVEARHMLAACGGAVAPLRADDHYVRTTFNKFAASFESQLARLGYRAPKLIELAAQQCLAPPTGQFDVLDAGCGTGLLGDLLKPWSARLVGVDLSPGMLERARSRSVYDDLVEQELGVFLGQHPSSYHLIASADTLCYFGALEEVAALSFDALRDGGRLLFTVEDGGEQTEGYKIQFHGRYAHRRDYVLGVLEQSGFTDVRVAAEALRMEGGRPVDGLIFAALKGDASCR